FFASGCLIPMFLPTYHKTKRQFVAIGLLLLAPALQAASPTVIIKGVSDGALKNNIKAHNDFGNEKCDLPTWRARGVERRAEAQTINALRALGYYEGKIKATHEDTDECWQVTITVDKSKPVLLHEVHISITGEAENDNAFNPVRQHEALQTGKAIEHNHYDDLKGKLVQIAADRGYMQSKLTDHRLEIDIKKRLAEAYLGLNSGPRYHFRRIRIEQDILHQKLADKFVNIKENDMYESDQLIKLQQALSTSGYYRNVRIRTETDDDEQAVDVVASAEARPRHGYMAGVGYSTDVGPRLRL